MLLAMNVLAPHVIPAAPLSYRFAYLLGSILFLALWTVLFWRRPDLRREMLVMGGLALLCGLPLEYYLWTRDWWHPLTITHTRVGIEDALYAFSTGGLMAVLYPWVFGLRMGASVPPPVVAVRAAPYLLILGVPPLLVLADMHSFAATTVGVLLALVIVLGLRADLSRMAVWSAVLALAVAMPVYWLCAWLFPGVIAAIWNLPKLSGVLILGIPVEDLVWYAYTAALYGTYYKFLTGQGVAPADREPSPRRTPLLRWRR